MASGDGPEKLARREEVEGNTLTAVIGVGPGHFFDRKSTAPFASSTNVPSFSQIERIGESTHLSFQKMLGISRSPIDMTVQETWQDILQCMNEDSELYEMNLRRIFQAHRMNFEALLEMIEGYFAEAHLAVDQYLRYRYPDQPDLQKEKEYLPEVRAITSIMEALNTLYAARHSLRVNGRRMSPEKKKYQKRIIFETMQLIGFMLIAREESTSPEMLNRAEDGYYFEHALVGEHIGMLDFAENMEEVEVRFVATKSEKSAIIYLPEDAGYDTLIPREYESTMWYRTEIHGRTSMKSLDREKVTVFIPPQKREDGTASIINKKTLASLILKRIRKAVDVLGGREDRPIYDRMRTTIVARTDRDLEKVTAMWETELGSTISTTKGKAKKHQWSSSEYNADQRTLWLTNEDKGRRRFYIELRLDKLSRLVLVESDKHNHSQKLFKRGAMCYLDPYLRPEKIYGKAE